jgi:hypothetical protein
MTSEELLAILQLSEPRASLELFVFCMVLGQNKICFLIIATTGHPII